LSLSVRFEIHDREAVQVRKLHEHPSSRPVTRSLECNGAHAFVELHFPGRLERTRIDHANTLADDRSDYHKFAVGRYIDVMRVALHGNCLHNLKTLRVKDVHGSRCGYNRRKYVPPIVRNGDIVGTPAERNLAKETPLLGLHHPNRAI